MKLSEFTIKYLAKAVCGDAGYTPYVKGYELISYFNKYGFNDTYGEGFPSRWKYTEDKLRELNGSSKIGKIIEETVDPRRYHGLGITVENAVSEINKFIRYDKIELRAVNDFYKLTSLNGLVIEPKATKEINHDFANEQIDKCFKKLNEGDYNGAITNARSLVEAIFIEIIETSENREIKNDGDLDNLWKKVKRIMKLDIDKSVMPEYVVQILSGIDTAVKGLAGLSNNAGDRHATKFVTRKHHAKLAVNLSMTLADFLLDSRSYQKEIQQKP